MPIVYLFIGSSFKQVLYFATVQPLCGGNLHFLKQINTFPKSYQEENFCGYRRQMLSGWVYGQSPSLRSIGAWFSKRKPILQQNPAFRRWTPMWPDVASFFFLFTPLSILKSRDRENGVKYNQAMSVWGFRLQVDNNSNNEVDNNNSYSI